MTTPTKQKIAGKTSKPAPAVNTTPSTFSLLKTLGSNLLDIQKPSPVVFPPPSWELSDELLGKSNTVSPPPNSGRSTCKVIDSRPEPISFAHKLKILIESLPQTQPASSASATANNPASPSSKNAGAKMAEIDDGKQGLPIPPGIDEGLVGMLSSEDVMNPSPPPNRSRGPSTAASQGVTTAKVGGSTAVRPGIWNILASLKKLGDEEGAAISNRIHHDRDVLTRPGAVEEEEDGVMLYAPLEPTTDSKLELGNSETIIEEDGNEVPDDSRDEGTCKKSDVDSGKTKVDGEPTLSPPPGPNSSSSTKGKGQPNVPRSGPSSPLARRAPRPGPKKHFVWVPSTTELSLLTTWWGYRLYLPPPVMAKLNGTSIKATARAAMLTTALKWLLEKIPIMMVPPQFRSAVRMLKQLSPVVGYVGVFISWSWERVRTCDKGNGVMLTATWLLPVALVPMTWDAGNIYRPVAAPSVEQRKAMAAAKEKKEKEKADEVGSKEEKETKANDAGSKEEKETKAGN